MKYDTDIQKSAFSARLNEAAKAADLHHYGMYSDLARHFGMSVPGVRKWFTGDVIPLQKIEQLASYYRVRPEWLRSGNGPMRELEGVDSEGLPQTVELHQVPVVTGEQWRDYANGLIQINSLPKVLATGELPAGCFALQVEDNSLSDRILKGMYVVVNPFEKPAANDLVVAHINGAFVSGLLAKRDTYMIIPPNTDYRPVDLGSEPEICGVMISVVQQKLK